MKVNPQQLMDDGYIVIRECIPCEQLDDLRENYETLVERQGGQSWLATSAQPRLAANSLVDEATSNTVEIWLHENTLGVSQQLLCLPEAGVAGMWMMCSPTHDHGPSNWHRDVHPIDMAPLQALQMAMLENMPRYLQWNIPLYDDDVFWVVPGSHRRLNTDTENQQLLSNAQVPLPDSIPVDLNAGDGVVYSNFLLHWGSNYSTKLRRTLHGGHSIFTHYTDLGFTKSLSPAARECFEGWERRSTTLQDLTESALRAIIDRDAGDYREALEGIQPGAGSMGKLVLTIYLCKAAYHIHILKRSDFDSLPEEVRRRARGDHTITLNWGPEFSNRFSQLEADTLCTRFETLDEKLQGDEENFVPGFQSGPMRYFFEEMPTDFSVEEFIASWET